MDPLPCLRRWLSDRHLIVRLRVEFLLLRRVALFAALRWSFVRR